MPKLKQNEKAVIATGVHGKNDGLNWTKNIKFKSILTYKSGFEFDERQFCQDEKVIIKNMANMTFKEYEEMVQGPNDVVLPRCFS